MTRQRTNNRNTRCNMATPDYIHINTTTNEASINGTTIHLIAKDGITINNHANADNTHTVTLELLAPNITITNDG